MSGYFTGLISKSLIYLSQGATPPSVVEKPTESSENTPLAMKKVRVLVAEDNAVCQTIIERVIKAKTEDFCVFTFAEDGKKAVAAVEAGEYDIIFMDNQMPEMSGSEASPEIHRINKEKKRKVVPIVVQSSDAKSRLEEEFFNCKVQFLTPTGKGVTKLQTLEQFMEALNRNGLLIGHYDNLKTSN